MIRILVAAVLALALPLASHAAAVVESLQGGVQVGDARLTVGQKIVAPTTVSTGPGAQAFLRFEDGMQIVLGENSLLRVVDFRFTPSGVTDRAVFDLMRGSARVVTGNIALKSPKQFFFRLPQTQLTVERPADFTVALINPAYVSVNVGSVVSSNTYGVSTLSAGSTSAIATNSAAVASIPASSLPAGASSAMSNLAVASVSAPAGSAATGLAAASAGGAGIGFVTPLVVVGAALAGVAAAAGNDDDNAAASHSATTHH
jgi:FecR protein